MTIQTITANGLEFAYYEQGAGDQLVLCLHGFPDTPQTWFKLLPKLADAGYRAVAPYMRGYPPSGIPTDADYSVTQLAADVIGLLDAFQTERAVVIGHDWGAFATYGAAALAPERLHKLVTVAIPHPLSLNLTAPRTLLRARHFVNFQRRQATVKWLQTQDYAALRTLYKRWSPNWRVSDADLDPVWRSLAQPGGFEGALGYYWSFWANRNDPDALALIRRKTETPTLSIFGEADGALGTEALTRTATAFTARYRQVLLPDVGHFLHREVPDKFASLVLEFLAE